MLLKKRRYNLVTKVPFFAAEFFWFLLLRVQLVLYVQYEQVKPL